MLVTQASKEGRIEAWRQAARTGVIFGADGEEIADYEGYGWNDQWRALDSSERGQDAFGEPAWLFY